MQHSDNQHTWVLVADNCQATLYRLIKRYKIEKITSFEHPESKLRNKDLVSSKPGHSGQQAGGTRYSYEPETQPRDLEAAHFAVELAEHLTSAERRGDFHHLYVLAEPSFLGLLRKKMGPDLQKAILAEVNKELTSCSVAEIETQLAAIHK